MREIRKVIGEIPILASEQRLLDEAGGEEEGTDKGTGAVKKTKRTHRDKLVVNVWSRLSFANHPSHRDSTNVDCYLIM